MKEFWVVLAVVATLAISGILFVIDGKLQQIIELLQ